MSNVIYTLSNKNNIFIFKFTTINNIRRLFYFVLFIIFICSNLYFYFLYYLNNSIKKNFNFSFIIKLCYKFGNLSRIN